MAMDGNEMAESIIGELLKGQDVDASVKKTMLKSWRIICNNIVKHIQSRGSVEGTFPAEPNSADIEYETNEMGNPVETQVSMYDVKFNIR